MSPKLLTSFFSFPPKATQRSLKVTQAGVPAARGFRVTRWKPGSPTSLLLARWGGSRNPRRARFSRDGVEAGVHDSPTILVERSRPRLRRSVPGFAFG